MMDTSENGGGSARGAIQSFLRFFLLFSYSNSSYCTTLPNEPVPGKVLEYALAKEPLDPWAPDITAELEARTHRIWTKMN